MRNWQQDEDNKKKLKKKLSTEHETFTCFSVNTICSSVNDLTST